MLLHFHYPSEMIRESFLVSQPAHSHHRFLPLSNVKSQLGTQAWYAIPAVLFSLPFFFLISNFKQITVVNDFKQQSHGNGRDNLFNKSGTLYKFSI